MSFSVTLPTLPSDSLMTIFSYMSASELALLSLVNKRFAGLSNEVAKDILRAIQKAYFPLLLSPNNPMTTCSNLKQMLHRLTINQTYTLGGAFESSQVNCFLPKSSKWYTSVDMLEEREQSEVVAVRGYIVAVSGESDSATGKVEVFSPYENVWSELPSLPAGVRYGAVVSMNDQVIVIGGVDTETNEVLSSAYTLDFGAVMRKSKASWTCSEEVMIEGRYGHSAVVYDGRIWIAGGSTVTDRYSADVETVAFEDGRLVVGEDIAPMNCGRRNFKLLVVNDNLYAVGGDEEGEGSIEWYNPVSGEWEISTKFTSYRRNFAATTDGENIFVFGGQSKRRAFLSTWDCFNVRTNSWTISNANMPANGTPGFSHGCAINMNFETLVW